MKNFLIILFLSITGNVFAHQDAMVGKQMQEQARGLLQNVFSDNAKGVASQFSLKLDTIQTSQTPRATVVSCSDSRVQSVNIDETPTNDLFFIRNIGNQIDTSIGSIKYGVQYLHTPVLLIIGHVGCGAVEAALSDYRHKPKAIKQELATIDLPVGITAREGVIQNVHNQVSTAMKLFEEEIKKKQLVVIGTVFDFKNEYRKGYNRLILINLNGQKNPQLIAKSSYLRGIKDVVIGTEGSN